MPQLDVLAYVSEVTWFIVIFISLYFLLLSKGLNNLHKILKFRGYILNLMKTDIKYIRREFYYFELSLKFFFVKIILNIKKVYELGLKKVDLLLEWAIYQILRNFEVLNIVNKLTFRKENIYNNFEVVTLMNLIKYVTKNKGSFY